MIARDKYRNARVAVIAGGASAEADISLQSARAVHKALLPFVSHACLINPSNLDELLGALDNARCDTALILMHGAGGEDGTVQEILDKSGIAYTGSGRDASRLAWDKLACKEHWRAFGLPTPGAMPLNNARDGVRAFEALDRQIVIKPRCGGSSLGLTCVRDIEAVPEAYDLAASYKEGVMAEYLVEGSEYTVSILNGRPLPVVCIESEHGVYDYAAKYSRDDTRYLCPAGLPTKEEAHLSQLALDAFQSLGCSGWGRVDVMRDADKTFQLLEMNSVPGMTSRSLVPMAARVAGFSFEDLVLEILDSARGRGADGV